MKLSNKQLNKIKDIPFRYDLHYKMWDWLSKHPGQTPFDYVAINPDEAKFAGDSGCFACEYATAVRDKLLTNEYTKFADKYTALALTADGALERELISQCDNNWKNELETRCMYCPMKLKNNGNCFDGLYDQWNGWLRTNSPDRFTKRIKLAEKIRDLPLNPMYNFKDVK